MRTFFIVAILVLTAALALAEPTVLAVHGTDIYIDLGAKDGVGAGTQLELLHEIVATDPRTNKTLRDRFALGTLTVAKSGDRLSVAHAEPTLASRVLAGDRVRLASATRTFIDPWAAQVEASKRSRADGSTTLPPTANGAPPIDHPALAGRAWRDTLGTSPEQRIARWQRLLADDPRTPYRKLVENEVASLEAQLRARDLALARARSMDARETTPRIVHLATEFGLASIDVLSIAAPPTATPRQQIDLAFLVRSPGEVERAWLYVKPPGAPGYRRLDLARDGDAYLRATIAAADVQPGVLAWYVEAKQPGPAGETAPVLGTSALPRTIQVTEVLTEAPIAAHRSHVDAHVDYVDFDGGLADGFDQYYQAEIDFTYRFIDPIYAVRVGAGSLSGKGGPKDVIDEDPSKRCLDATGMYRCKSVDFTYVYTEFEVRLRPQIAIMLRPQAGILTTDSAEMQAQGRCRGSSEIDNCRFATGLGARARIRFGAEDATNLVVGASFTKGVGTLLEAAYHWLPTEMVPVQLTVQVTDQPLPEDFGVRLVGDVGLRKLSWFYPSLRLSYQARDIDHAGVSGGLAMNFDW